MYKKLKRSYSIFNMDSELYDKLIEQFPELENLDLDELKLRFARMGLEFYTESKVPVKWYIRITLPFALIMWTLMFLYLPIRYMIKGDWGYNLTDKNIILNWFRALDIYNQ